MKRLKTRDEIKRESQERRAAKVAARAGVKKVNAKRGGHRFPGGVVEELREFVRHWPCALAGFPGHVCFYDWKSGPDGRYRGSDPAHVGATEAQGRGDYNALVPLCRTAHREQEGRTKSFEAKYGINLQKLALRVTARWLKERTF